MIVGARTPAAGGYNIECLGRPIPAELWRVLRERDLIREDAPDPT